MIKKLVSPPAKSMGFAGKTTGPMVESIKVKHVYGRNRVLIVDDDKTTLGSLSFLFREFGWEVYIASSAKAALECLQDHTFQLVLSDLQMPEMDGIEFLQEVRKRYGINPPFFLFSGHITPETTDLALDLGAQLVLPKSVKTEEMFAALAACGLSRP